MSVTPRAPGPRTVFGKSSLALTARITTRRGEVRRWVLQIVKERGRPRTNDVAAWVARIEGAEFQDIGSLRAKCRELAWRQHVESGGDPDISRQQFDRLAESRHKAVMRWYKKQP